MAFIFNGEEDWSGDDSDPTEAMDSILAHVEFDTVADLEELAGALRIPYLAGIYLGSLPEGKAGKCSYYTDGTCEVVLDCHSVLVAVHEFAHCLRRPDKDCHGSAFKKRMAKLMAKAERYLEDKIEVPEPEPYAYTPRDLGDWWTPKEIETVTTVEPIAENALPLWALLDGLKEGAE